MQLVFQTVKVQKQCTDLKVAKKLFGGNLDMAVSLLSRINALRQASVLKDIIMMQPFHFHKLKGSWEGYFAIDAKTRRDFWRIILRPLNDDEEPYVPCNIDEIADKVIIVEIKEVSNHYE